MLEATKAVKHHAARLNRMIQSALLGGLLLSMALMLTGALLYFLAPQTQGATSISLQALLPGLAAGNPLAFMVMGVIVLMITPAFRVLVAAIGYILEGDWTFALVSLGVVAVLSLSVVIGAS
jgi:uncharacterized membrane protein